MADDNPPVLLVRKNGVATVLLNRSETGNALDHTMAAALAEALDRVEGDPSMTALVLAGSGSVFSAGRSAARSPAQHADYARCVELLMRLPLRTVAAVDGVCIGAGLALALACDHRVHSVRAMLGASLRASEVLRDPVLKGVLIRRIGTGRAATFARLGVVPAHEASFWGVDGVITAADCVLVRAHALARSPEGCVPATISGPSLDLARDPFCDLEPPTGLGYRAHRLMRV